MLRIYEKVCLSDDHVVAVAAGHVIWSGRWPEVPDGLGKRCDTLLVSSGVYRRVVQEIATNVNSEEGRIVGHKRGHA